MRFPITPMLLALLMAGCDDSPSGPSDPLAGTYDWVRSTGGFAGRTLTPETEGGTIRLELDGRGGARATMNGTVTLEGRYSVTELPTMGPLPAYEVTWTPPFPAFFLAVFEHHTLIVPPGLLLFTDPCCDGWAHTFREDYAR